MNKYLLVAKNTWYETVTYRFNFVMWRIRVVFQMLTVYFLWLAIIPSNGNFLGYTKPLMLTYILGTSFISSITLASRSYGIGEEINNGNLSNFLIKPINYFLYWFAKDMGDKAMNILFSILELTILFLLLHPPIFIQTNILIIFLSLVSAMIALTLYFFFNILLGLIGFWSPEVWAPRFIFIILLNFFAGSLFPLDILPKSVFYFLQALPFTYILYFPLKIYLGQLSQIEIYTGFFISTIWVFILYWLVKIIWAKGLAVYTAYGR